MPQSKSDSSKFMFANKQHNKASLLTVFLRSARYEGKFLLHNSWDYLMLLWLPLLTIFGTWWIFSKPYIVDLPIGVIDESRSGYSRTLTRYLDASPDLKVHKLYLNTDESNDALLNQEIYGVVLIPHDFADEINQAKPSPVILKVNAQYGSHSGIVQRGVQSVVGTLSAGVEIKRTVKQGSYPEQAKISYSPIGIERINLFNMGASYQQFLASTVIPALLHILAMIIGATTIGRELRDRTFASWYQNMAYTDMPYPDFKTLKQIPPEQKLAHVQSALSNHWQPSNRFAFLENQHYGYVPYAHSALTIQPNSYQAFNAQLTPDLNTPILPEKVSAATLIAGLNGKLIWATLIYTLWGALSVMLATSAHATDWLPILLVFIAFIALTMISFWLGAIFSLSSYSLRMGLSSTAFISAPSFAFAGVTYPLVAMSEGAQRWANALPLTHYLKVHISQLQMLAPSSIALPTLKGLMVAVIATLLITVLLSLRAFKNPHKWGAR